jgi:hypothetical protein
LEGSHSSFYLNAKKYEVMNLALVEQPVGAAATHHAVAPVTMTARVAAAPVTKTAGGGDDDEYVADEEWWVFLALWGLAW